MKTQLIPSATEPWPSRPGVRQRGFTLIELIMVMVMLGVLAMFAAPRIFSTSDVYARGFHDETLAYLRYAQKAAIAQRRMVCANFDVATTPNTLVLTMENPTPTAVPVPNVGCNKNLAGPKGDTPAKVQAGSGTGYGDIKTGNAAVTSLIFNGLGQPVNAARGALSASTSIEISNAAPIRIEANTGYVHD